MKSSSLRLLLSTGTLAVALVFAGCGGGGHKATPVSFSQTTLQAATDGTSYSQTLTVTGGTAPYTWTVSSGALPAGMTLSSSGVLSGTPTVSGTFNFSVTVTDSSKPVQSLTASYTLSVAAPPISISSSSLPAGIVGVAYSQALTAAGGTPPFTWTVSSGSLPAGLTLSSAGVLSGTPSAVGTFTFSIKVTDSSSPVQSLTSSYTLTIAAPPISITQPTLPAGTVNVAYSQTLVATGGTAPFSWSLASGTLPAGITLSSVGVLSGTPTTAGTYSFAVTVTDSGTPVQTATTGAVTLTIAPAARTGTALLQGQYFFKVDLFADGSPNSGSHEFYVGSLTFDGAGNITAGVTDLADDNYDADGGQVTGTYTIGRDGRGTLTLNLFQTQVFALAVGASTTQGGVATRARFVQTDAVSDYLNFGPDYSTGFLQLQDPTAFTNASLIGSDVFGWSGDTYDGDAQISLPQQGGLALVGQIIVGNDLNLAAGSTADIATNQTTDTNFALAGSVAPDNTAVGSSTSFSTFGRALLNLTTTTYPNGLLPAQSVIYVIDANTSYVISYPQGSYEPLYSGYLLRQQPGTFSAGSLSGSAIAHGASTAVNGQAAYAGVDVLTLYGTSEAFVSRYNADGAGNLTTVTDANIAGSIISAQTNTLTYTVAASGRTTFSGAASPILWLSGTNAGFAITPPPAAQPLLLTLEPQMSASYSTATLNGPFLVGIQDLASNFTTLLSGESQADGAGNVTGTIDFFTDSGAQFVGSNALTEQGTISVDANGRATFAGNYISGGVTVGTQQAVYYLTSPTSGVGIEVSNTDPKPGILTFEPGIQAPPSCGGPVVRPRSGSSTIHPDC